jgi:translocation and assembly module TamA
VLSYLQQTLTWDRRNDPIEPTKGFFLQLDIQEAGGPLGGSFSNTRWLPEARAYFPVTKYDVLAVRLQMGALFTYDGSGSPVDQRFFLGGIDSVRGYGAERLSPMVRVNTCAPIKVKGSYVMSPVCGSNGTSGLGVVDVQVGGNGMIEGTVEVRHKLSDIFHVVAFVDMGEVTSQPLNFNFQTSTLAITPGLGLRIITPVGALRVDLAYRATDPDRQITNFIGYGTPGAPSPPPANSPYSSAEDICPWPFFPTTGWSSGSALYQHPSTCKSQFLNNFAFNIAIGEAF